MNEIELKPCPFCGAPAEMKETCSWDYYVKCTSCGARTRNHHEYPNGAANRWNSRKEVRPERVCMTCSRFSSSGDLPYCTWVHQKRDPLEFCSRWEGK